MLERVNKVPLPNIQIVDMRKEKNLEIEINTLDNNKISKSLRFKTN